MHRFGVVVLLAPTVALTATLGAWPQLGLPRAPKRLPREVSRLDRLPSLDDLLNRQPLTSTLDDAVTEVPFLDRFDPEAVHRGSTWLSGSTMASRWFRVCGPLPSRVTA